MGVTGSKPHRWRRPRRRSRPLAGRARASRGTIPTVIDWSGSYHVLATPFTDDGGLDTAGLPHRVEILAAVVFG
jgi:hypothetical protein